MFGSICMLTIGGILGVTALCPLEKVAWRFVRLVGVLMWLTSLGVLFWSLKMCSYQSPAGIVFICAALVVILTCIGILKQAPKIDSLPRVAARRLRVLSAVGAAGAIGGGCAGLSNAEMFPVEFGVLWVMALVGNLLSAFLIGSVNIGWLLGHRYLTATDMTIDPLKKVGRLLLIAVSGRWLFLLGGALVLLLVPDWSMHSSDRMNRLRADWLMLSIRVGVGLMIPSVFVFMAWQCVKLRSTQSATGILFFAAVLVLIGELTSQYLGQNLGFPL